MKAAMRWIVPGLALMLLIAVSPARATETMAESEGLKCTTCHDKPGSRLLTSKGKYYELRGSFDGYDEVIKKYKKCTKCHAQYPGSQKLTKKGEKFKAQGKTMDHVTIEPAHTPGGDSK